MGVAVLLAIIVINTSMRRVMMFRKIVVWEWLCSLLVMNTSMRGAVMFGTIVSKVYPIFSRV